MKSFLPKLSSQLKLEKLEDRATPVIGGLAQAPLVQLGTGFDGVVQVQVGQGSGTGSLLADGYHILTAAHVVTDASAPLTPKDATVIFQLPNLPAGTDGKIKIVVPAANITVNPNYKATSADGTPAPDYDLAVLTLPVIAPSGGVGVGADRYPLYRTADEVGKDITVVGYGTVGTGTTGETENTNDTKGIVFNRYDVVGERLGFAPSTSLLYDFDNGSAANDAFGRIFGINDTGVANEGSGSAGDSGGPVFITLGGQRYIAGTTTSGPTETEPNNPATLNPGVKSGFGSISHDMRMSTFAPAFIDPITAKAVAVTLDLRYQPAGLDAVADAVTVRAAGTNLELVVNGTVFQSIPLSQVSSLTLIGAGTGTPFTTTAVIQNGVPTALAITYDRILSVADNRTATVSAPPADAPPKPTPPAEPPPGVPPEVRPAPAIDLGTVPNLLSPSTLVAVSGGGGRVKLYDAAKGNALRRDFQPFDGFGGPLSTAFGDVTGDFVKDLAVAAGQGGGPRVTVFDAGTGGVVRDFLAFEPGFRGGVSVALADVNGDGVDDIVAGAGSGGGPRVTVFDGATGAVIRDFFAFEPTFRGGVNVSAGDVNDDGYADVIVAPGAGGGPRVRVISGADGTELRSFLAYDAGFTGGVFVAAGDVNGDGSLDVITGAGAGGASHVKVFDGATGTVIQSFFAYDLGFRGGVRVAAADADGDGLTDVVTGAGAGGGPHVRTFKGGTSADLGGLFAFDATFTGGVYVGGQG